MTSLGSHSTAVVDLRFDHRVLLPHGNASSLTVLWLMCTFALAVFLLPALGGHGPGSSNSASVPILSQSTVCLGKFFPSLWFSASPQLFLLSVSPQLVS